MENKIHSFLISELKNQIAIQLENNVTTCEPGKFLKGDVFFLFESPVDAKTLNLTFKGRECVYFSHKIEA